MREVLFFVPFGYFATSRLKNFKNLIFHSYFEWIPAICILFLVEGKDLLDSIYLFILGYLAFISIYEIGYLANDQLSEKREVNPRMRFDKNLGKMRLLVLIVVRLITFLGISWYLDLHGSFFWWIFYLFLGLSFFLHNTIRNNDYRLITFFNLSVFRFFAPFFIFCSKETLQLLFPVVLVCYSFYRTLIYMDNKELLSVQSRKSPLFNLSFFIITILVIGFYSIIVSSVIPILLATYFAIFTFVYYLKNILLNG